MDTLPLCKHNLLIPISMPYLTVNYLKWPSFLYLSIHTMFFIIQLKILIHQCFLNSIFHQMIIVLLWISNILSIALLGFPGGSVIKNLPANEEMWVWSLGEEDPLEKEVATHSSILAWEIPWTEKWAGHRSQGHKRLRHDLVTKQQQQNSFITLSITWFLYSSRFRVFSSFCLFSLDGVEFFKRSIMFSTFLFLP